MNANRAYHALLHLLQSQLVLGAEKIKTSKKLVRPVATYGAGSWKLNKSIVKRLAAIERNFLRRMFEGIQENENWRKRFNSYLANVENMASS